MTVYLEEDDETEVYQIVTTMRQDALHGLVSKESPMGKALLGRRVGDRPYVQVNEQYGYYVAVSYTHLDVYKRQVYRASNSDRHRLSVYWPEK